MMRAVERIDPVSMYGKTFPELTRDEMVELLGYEYLREEEIIDEHNRMFGKK